MKPRLLTPPHDSRDSLAPAIKPPPLATALLLIYKFDAFSKLNSHALSYHPCIGLPDDAAKRLALVCPVFTGMKDDDENILASESHANHERITPPMEEVKANEHTPVPTKEDPKKINAIYQACKDPGKTDQVIALATSANGLVDDEVRRQACRLNKPNLIPDQSHSITKGRSCWATA